MKRLLLILLIHIITINAQTPIAVLDFLSNGLSENETKALTDRFRNELFQYKNFDIMERGYMEEILDEQGFQLSGCTSDECVIEAGKLIGVEQMVGGSISRVGETYTIAARIISVETGKITNTATYDYTGEIDMLLKEGMKQVASELSYEKPAEKKFGYLTINSKTPETKIYINDRYTTTNSIRAKQLQVDDYKISLQSKYYFSLDTIVTLMDDESSIISLSLQPDLKTITQEINKKQLYKRGLYILSAVSLGISGYCKYSADQMYEDYDTARDDAKQLHQDIKLKDNIALGTLGVGFISFFKAVNYSFEIRMLNKMLRVETQYNPHEFSLGLEVNL